MLFEDHGTARYEVRLNSNEILARLKDSIEPEGWFFDAGDKPAVGTLSGRSFRLRMPQTTRNSFKPYLFGTVEETAEGSRIEVRLGLHPFIKPFMMLWLGTVGLGCAVLPLSILIGSRGRWYVALIPPGMLLFGIALVRFGRWFGRSEEERLMAFADRLWGPRV